MKKWQGYRPEIRDESYDAIIIGSGMSGLTTAVLLAEHGQKVLVLEKHFKVGGFTHTFKRKNYEWDVGIHYIGEVHNKKSYSRRLFDRVTDGNLKWAKMDDNYDRIIFPDKSYDFIAPQEKFIETLSIQFPGEEEAIRAYVRLLHAQVKSGRGFFASKALPKWLAPFLRNAMTKQFFKNADKSTKEVLKQFTRNEKLIGVLTGQWGDYGLPPKRSSFAMHAMVARHYLDGGNYPVGGSRMIAEYATDLIESLGGKIVVNAGVDEILVQGKRAIGVRLDNGDELFAKTIVSSAGLVNTVNTFLRNQTQSNQFKSKMKKVQPTESYVCLYMGLNKTAQELGLKTTNLWIYPGYDHDQNVTNYTNDPKGEFPVVYVSFPSAKDPDWVKNHPGCATMEAITLGRWDDYKEWENEPWKKRGASYEEFKKSISKKILDVVYQHVPQAEGAMDFYELSTPLSVRDMAHYPAGEMYGLDHTSERFRQNWLRPQTEINNFFLTGQDVTTVGLTSALFSGLLTASSILNKNLMKSL
ncbi:MAG: NAD(P)/FAD-dependent oxidoreductase [Candidatus Marinimicrobia bacterium]|jgi:all-trans-retinol 13,14-reductase|nr:NAD(P)/FAD-dependent oxidoreductase [Candidatus Neomarinimicrobiota bacterium]MBT3675426.1 NAD(P)/FAD-dependent oxidoreductase [Candidatus Neomarinimicrobiota bacterium]MBT3762534.1 NAD(P)/FAD-dependent oxidoreductase [Candidatus Neomarinimicrobiota bacterium]MBT4068995.1 NAD(P)/FAD-dependent oxidoreductase [Candidatus Neomarinimicrobiota bacterium]MBT4270913.1 NAD(P)/FAD-dependent oxidoreductase [Candidatus Neomarinimicrobiota bacterium]